MQRTLEYAAPRPCAMHSGEIQAVLTRDAPHGRRRQRARPARVLPLGGLVAFVKKTCLLRGVGWEQNLLWCGTVRGAIPASSEKVRGMFS